MDPEVSSEADDTKPSEITRVKAKQIETKTGINASKK
ncbi:MAG: hypothetical protein ACI9MS_001546 [Glaciecola sp.]|jgi:hypothetical protein